MFNRRLIDAFSFLSSDRRSSLSTYWTDSPLLSIKVLVTESIRDWYWFIWMLIKVETVRFVNYQFIKQQSTITHNIIVERCQFHFVNYQFIKQTRHYSQHWTSIDQQLLTTFGWYKVHFAKRYFFSANFFGSLTGTESTLYFLGLYHVVLTFKIDVNFSRFFVGTKYKLFKGQGSDFKKKLALGTLETRILTFNWGIILKSVFSAKF